MITSKVAWLRHATEGGNKGLRPLDPNKTRDSKGFRVLASNTARDSKGIRALGFKTVWDSKGRSPLGILNKTTGWLCQAVVLLFFVTQTSAATPLNVVASIPVLAQFLEEIAPGDVAITVLTKPGGSAHVFEPSATQIVEIRRADLFFALPSLSHERGYLKSIQRLNKQLRVIDLEKEKPVVFANDKDLRGDPHSWMAPAVLVTMVNRMVSVLSLERPAQSVLYRQRGQVIVQRLMAEDRRMKNALNGVKPAAFLTYHPSFGYFAKAYGLTQHGLEREGKSISAAYLRRVLSNSKEAGVTTFFVHPGLDPAMVSRVTTFMPCRVISVDVLNPDIFAVWRHLTDALAPQH